MDTLKDKERLEEQLNKAMELTKALRSNSNQMRAISFIAIYVGVISTIILIKIIFW